MGQSINLHLPGRPKRPLVDSACPLTERVRHLIDAAHGGNLSHASALTRMSYPTLRDLYAGENTTPAVRTIEKLSAPYGLEPGWLLGAGEVDAVPVVGRVGLVPPDPRAGQKSRALREVLIPFRAWSMFRLVGALERQLEQMGPRRDRPIVAEATGDAFLFRLTTFLLQPLLVVEKLALSQVIVVAQGSTAYRPLSDEDLVWISCLRQLGDMWSSVLPQSLIAGEAV